MNNSCQEQMNYHRNRLRLARDAALRDSEGYQQVLFALEQMGQQLWKEGGAILTLGSLKPKFLQFVRPSLDEGRFNEFRSLYGLVQDGRNDAMHVGAVARNLTANCVRISIILEDCLMAKIEDSRIKYYMVYSPIRTYEWQRIVMIRQTMLEYSFSHLPFFRKEHDRWDLVSAYDICRYLCVDRERLSRTLGDAIQENDGLKTEEAADVGPDATLQCILNKIRGDEPVLVLHPETRDLVGIANAFDLM